MSGAGGGKQARSRCRWRLALALPAGADRLPAGGRGIARRRGARPDRPRSSSNTPPASTSSAVHRQPDRPHRDRVRRRPEHCSSPRAASAAMTCGLSPSGRMAASSASTPLQTAPVDPHRRVHALRADRRDGRPRGLGLRVAPGRERPRRDHRTGLQGRTTGRSSPACRRRASTGSPTWRSTRARRRLFFGVGTATNSGVVGMDDFAIGWPQDHPNVHDIPYKKLVLWGRRFDTPNPNASPLFGIGEIAVSGAVPAVRRQQPDGHPRRAGRAAQGAAEVQRRHLQRRGGRRGDQGRGLRHPLPARARVQQGRVRGDALHQRRDGDARAPRPVKDDPDSVLRLSFAPGEQIHWYGWPDYTTDLRPVTDRHFWPPERMLLPHGYPDLSFVINRDDSDLLAPTPGDFLVGAFPSQSGAAGIEFVPSGGPFRHGTLAAALVALSGDRAPFATGGIKVGPVGYKVMLADADRPGRHRLHPQHSGRPRQPARRRPRPDRTSDHDPLRPRRQPLHPRLRPHACPGRQGGRGPRHRQALPPLPQPLPGDDAGEVSPPRLNDVAECRAGPPAELGVVCDTRVAARPVNHPRIREPQALAEDHPFGVGRGEQG